MTVAQFEAWYSSRFHRTSSALIALAFIIADFFGVMLSFGAGFFMVNFYDMTLINFSSFVMYWPYLPVFVLLFWLYGLYPGISLAPAEELRFFVLGSIIAHGGVIFSRFIEDGEFDTISIAFIISFICSCFILLFCRSCMRIILGKTKLGGVPAVIYGNGSMAHLLIDHLLKESYAGYVPVLILDNDTAGSGMYKNIPVIHDTSIGQTIVEKFNIKMAIFAMPIINKEELTHLFNNSLSAFRYTVIVPDFFNIATIGMRVRDFNGILGFGTSHKLKMFWNLGVKRAIDMVLTIIGGSIILPFLLIIALLIKITSPGPVLYGHVRVGQHGKPFTAWKFRSMAVDSKEQLRKLLDSDPAHREEWERNHKLKDDPRVTKIGKLLRKFSIDEFPQLINVLKGEMSLVGPRPVVEAEAAKYGENFARIFSVKPGMTGLWQVSGRSDTDYAERVFYDTYYMQSWSIWLDVWILYKTIGVVLRGKGAY
ncbi:MAG: undecaprenyl-phosphate galactose phosphotransferase WbaP [Treponema sp.]|jgi:Undecaprenyl-phosphate galactose phosphotransferase WbaP|nr:undecaprenyl-phosphate galactose phosphotransferase WbaP [Treponema sp.]